MLVDWDDDEGESVDNDTQRQADDASQDYGDAEDNELDGNLPAAQTMLATNDSDNDTDDDSDADDDDDDANDARMNNLALTYRSPDNNNSDDGTTRQATPTLSRRLGSASRVSGSGKLRTAKRHKSVASSGEHNELDAAQLPQAEEGGASKARKAAPIKAKPSKKAEQRVVESALNEVGADVLDASTKLSPDVQPQLTIAREFVGRVLENERVVALTPKLVASNAEVCDLELLQARPGLSLTNSSSDGRASSDDQEEQSRLPFQVAWIDREKGEATLEVRRGEAMNCERKSTYKFRLVAIGCNGLKSNE